MTSSDRVMLEARNEVEQQITRALEITKQLWKSGWKDTTALVTCLNEAAYAIDRAEVERRHLERRSHDEVGR